jgi:hypothetical protein
MRRAWVLPLVACLALAAAGAGCGDDDGAKPEDPYLPLTSPENLVENLRRSWEARDLEGYARLLAPEFRFYFQEDDVPPGLPASYWGLTEDTTGTGGLFATPEVLDIRVAFTIHDAVPATGPGLPAGAMLVRTHPAQLEVDLDAGVSLIVTGDLEDFTCRPGDSGLGEDPGRWFILRWEDKPGGSGGDVALDTAIEPLSWTRIKQMFR